MLSNNASLGLIPRGVWVLGFVSMFMDISSEMIHALLPIYLVTVLGTSALTVGFIEGIAEATALITKIFSGALSDWLGRRKLLAAIGYGLAAFTKPVFPLAGSVGWLVAARFIDRIGKGIRGAPRDALVADLTPPALRGASFGLRQALDTVGAFLGPLIAIALMLATGDNYILVFWVAVIPAFLSLGLITVGVGDPPRVQAENGARRLHWRDAQRLPAAFWMVVGAGSLLTLARFSEAFLLLKAQNVGLAAAWIPAVLVVMNIAYAFSAYPAGAASDRIGRSSVMLAGIGLLIIADVMLAASISLPLVFLGTIVWGLHMGFTQGLIATLIADTAPADLRGTAFGMFNLAAGIATLLASVIAGVVWDAAGPAATFIVGAAFAVVALAAFIGVGRGRHASP
ncbi:MAG: MFS transporter [Hyphomicrobium sp.]|jgi:MFS family permease